MRSLSVLLLAASAFAGDQPAGAALHPLQRSEVEAAIRAAADAAGWSAAEIEVTEFGARPVPEGKLVFPRNGVIGPNPSQLSGLALWRGRWECGAHRSLPVWARVRITVRASCVRARAAVAAGVEISGSDVESAECRVFPGTSLAATVESVTGNKARRAIAEGMVIEPRMLFAPFVVKPGDEIEVEVRARGAGLHLTAVAAAHGRIGSNVKLKNLQSGRQFVALLRSARSAVVEVGR